MLCCVYNWHFWAASATIAEVEANRATPSSANASTISGTRLDQKFLFSFSIFFLPFVFFLACWHSTEPLLGCLFIYLLVRERTGTSRGIAFNHLARSNNKRGGSNGTDVDIDNARESILYVNVCYARLPRRNVDSIIKSKGQGKKTNQDLEGMNVSTR